LKRPNPCLNPSGMLGNQQGTRSMLRIAEIAPIVNDFSAYFRGNCILRPSDLADSADVVRHDRMVALGEAMLDLHRKLVAAVTDQEKAVFQRQIVATDRLIDRLVYELYGLTEEEIGIVESAS